jgi:hypothetical protein
MVPSIMSKSAEGKKRGSSKSVYFPEEEESFAQVVCEVESCFDFSEEDKKKLWFTRSDYHFSRSTARVIAKESERYGHSKHLDNAYVTTFSQEVQDQLNMWTLHGPSRRGLERWASTAHGLQRKDDQYMYINGLLRAQQEMKLRDEFTEERLREVGHILSRKSRLCAQMMGAADEEAAKWNPGMNSMGGIISPNQRRKNLNLGFQGPAGKSLNLGLQGPAGKAVSPSTRRPSRRVSDTQPMLRRGAESAHVAQRRSSDLAKPPPKITIKTRRDSGRQARMA